MPREWHDRHAVNKIENDETRNFYRSIVADKKPYFMRYIYPNLMKQYNTYIKNTNQNALREFQMTVDELLTEPCENLTDAQRDFIRYYKYRLPVGTEDCVMNKICRRFEEKFDGHIRKHNATVKFNYQIMKGNAEYTSTQLYAIKKLYEEYNIRLQGYKVFAIYERVDKYDVMSEISAMDAEFLEKCSKICPNRNSLCNIVLDICYTKNSTKKFAWSICGSDIIHNLLKNNDYEISFPVIDSSGEIEYCGQKYKIKSKRIEVDKQ